jgi:hypothetical protein
MYTAPPAAYAPPAPTYVPPAAYPQPTYAPPVAAPYGGGGFGQFQQGLGQVASFLQSFRPGGIPPLPGQAYPGMAAPSAMGYPSHAGPQTDATSLLRMFLGSPHLHQALQSAAVFGQAGPRTMELPMPAYGVPGGMRTVQIPLGAVLNPIMSLAGRAMEEMNASTREDDPELPEYLVGEDGQLLVDPANPDQRAALVVHMMRASQEATRSGWFSQGEGADEGVDEGVDESEAWAREAGFDI